MPHAAYRIPHAKGKAIAKYCVHFITIIVTHTPCGAAAAAATATATERCPLRVINRLTIIHPTSNRTKTKGMEPPSTWEDWQRQGY